MNRSHARRGSWLCQKFGTLVLSVQEYVSEGYPSTGRIPTGIQMQKVLGAFLLLVHGRHKDTVMPRARASEENRQLALEFACYVTTSEQAADCFVARRGPYSIYSVLRQCLPGVIRDDQASHSNRKGVSEAEFLRSLSESGKFERYRDRKAVKRSDDPAGAGMCLVKAHRWRNPASMSDVLYLRNQHRHLSQIYPEFAKFSLEFLCMCLGNVIAAWGSHGPAASAIPCAIKSCRKSPALQGAAGSKRQREEEAVASALLELQKPKVIAKSTCQSEEIASSDTKHVEAASEATMLLASSAVSCQGNDRPAPDGCCPGAGEVRSRAWCYQHVGADHSSHDFAGAQPSTRADCPHHNAAAIAALLQLQSTPIPASAAPVSSLSDEHCKPEVPSGGHVSRDMMQTLASLESIRAVWPGLEAAGCGAMKT